MVAVNVTRGAVLASRLRVASGFWARLAGLMGRRPLLPGEGLLLRPCAAVHTMFVRGRLDLVFLDGASRVVGLAPETPPWRPGLGARGARSVLELPPGVIASTGTREGDVVALDPQTGGP